VNRKQEHFFIIENHKKKHKKHKQIKGKILTRNFRVEEKSE